MGERERNYPEERGDPGAGALRPIYCLADSQLLFWRREDGSSWLESVAESAREARGRGADGAPLRAAYVGASNGDERAFYSIFAGAMEGVGITEHRMIRSGFGDEERAWLGSSDLVLLAGGDPVRGWRIFEQSGMREVITGRYFQGATLIGISAGAVQLGWAYPDGAS
jgi:cyanophycinase-like exopeptidase